MTAPLTAPATGLPKPTASRPRIASVDFLRGLVMIIMALDHVRDFYQAGVPDPTNLDTTTPLLFGTRWITHFCAPTFVFLSGLSAYLSSWKRTPEAQGRFLVKRGVWLVLIEVTVITFCLSFNPFFNIIILQVIWVIGASMILLGLLIKWPKVILVIGILLFFGHNLLDYVQGPTRGAALDFWTFFLQAAGSYIPFSTTRGVLVLYALLPWTGVLFLGYSAGFLLFRPGFDPARRRRILAWAGLGVVVLFVVLRFINRYGDPFHWSVQRNPAISVIAFLNTVKYPPSLMYLCMTLGPSLLVLSCTEGLRGRLGRIISVYGRVPFFYYMCHLFLIHLGVALLFFLTGHTMSEAGGTSISSLFMFRLNPVGFGLGGVYLVWLILVFILFFPCRWYDRYKRSHTRWWLSYI